MVGLRTALLAGTCLVWVAAARAQPGPGPSPGPGPQPAVPLSYFNTNIPGGIVPTGQDGKTILSDLNRNPNPTDGRLFHYSCGDNYACAINAAGVAATNTLYNGDIWYNWATNQAFINTQNAISATTGGLIQPSSIGTIGQADWSPIGATGLAADGTTTAPARMYSLYRLRYGFVGNVATAYKLNSGGTLVSQTISQLGYGPDTATLDGFCGVQELPQIVPTRATECILDLNDQSVNGAGYAVLDYGAANVAVNVGGTGYHVGDNTVLTSVGGTASVATTVTVTGTTTGGVASSIILDIGGSGTAQFQAQGVFSTSPQAVNAGPVTQTQASTTGTGVGLTVSVSYLPSYGPVSAPWMALSLGNQTYRTFLFNSQLFSAGNYAWVNSKYMRTDTGYSYTPTTNTAVFIGANMMSAGAGRGMLSDPTDTYGWLTSTGNQSSPTMMNQTTKHCSNAASPFSLLDSPSILILRASGTTFACYQNDFFQLGNVSNVATISAQTGAVIGSTGANQTSFAYNALAVMLYNAPISANDIQTVEVNSAYEFHLPMQEREEMVIGGASMSTIRGDWYTDTIFSKGNNLLPQPLAYTNLAISGQQIITEDNSFASLSGDSQGFWPFARYAVWQNMGGMDDVNALCTNGSNCGSLAQATAIASAIKSRLQTWVSLAENQAAGEYLAVGALCNGTPNNCAGATGATAGETLVFTPPGTITCSTNPTLTISGVQAGVPAQWAVTTPGECNAAPATFTGWTITDSGGSSGTTWTPAWYGATVPAVILGTVPLQGVMLSNSPAMLNSVVSAFLGDIESTYSLAQPGGNWSCVGTSTVGCGALGTSGYGAAGLNDAKADPIVGPGNWYSYSALAVNDCASGFGLCGTLSLSGDGQHGNEAAKALIATGFGQAVRVVTPPGY